MIRFESKKAAAKHFKVDPKALDHMLGKKVVLGLGLSYENVKKLVDAEVSFRLATGACEKMRADA